MNMHMLSHHVYMHIVNIEISQWINCKPLLCTSAHLFICFDLLFLTKAFLGPYAWESKGTSTTPMTRCTNPPELKETTMTQPLNKPLPTTVSGTKSCLGEDFLKHAELEGLKRSFEVFSRIRDNPIFSYRLPKPDSTAGSILKHASDQFNKILLANEPMTFKFGITHDAHTRWFNDKFGYKRSADPFEKMHIVYAAANPYGPAFLEASLIDRFGSYLIVLRRILVLCVCIFLVHVSMHFAICALS